jgi:hypothetical protein
MQIAAPATGPGVALIAIATGCSFAAALALVGLYFVCARRRKSVVLAPTNTEVCYGVVPAMKLEYDDVASVRAPPVGDE